MKDNGNGNAGRLLAPVPLLGRVPRQYATLWRRRQWARNVARLKLKILNALTLGLGENIWYGDILYQDLNVSLLGRCSRLVRVNLNHFKVAAAAYLGGGKQISNARNKGERRWYRRIRLTNRYELEVVVVHKNAMRPNDRTELPPPDSDGGSRKEQSK